MRGVEPFLPEKLSHLAWLRAGICLAKDLQLVLGREAPPRVSSSYLGIRRPDRWGGWGLALEYGRPSAPGRLAPLAIEASRLARNNADWQRLIWFCSLTATLLGDQDGQYDPSHLDDRMVLGLKGTLSELEGHTLRKRLHEAAVNKARRGGLRSGFPRTINGRKEATGSS